MKPIHASCIEWNGEGVVVCGPSGSGKSDLALRLIDIGAVLVADDQVILENKNSTLYARVPETIKGLLEIRGLGIVPMPYKPETILKLKVILRSAHKIDRMPDPMHETIQGVDIPVLFLDPSMASAVAKIKLALSVHSGEREILQ